MKGTKGVAFSNVGDVNLKKEKQNIKQ